MIFKQGDLFRGIDRGFVKSIMDLTEKESYGKGDILFAQGDHAGKFFILLKGRVRLTTGEGGQLVYVVGRGGEAFGWSSLVGRDFYSATAQCMAPTKLLKIDRDEFKRLLEGDPANGLVFITRLAATIGERLVNSYNSLIASHRVEGHETYGTSQTLRQRVVV